MKKFKTFSESHHVANDTRIIEVGGWNISIRLGTENVYVDAWRAGTGDDYPRGGTLELKRRER